MELFLRATGPAIAVLPTSTQAPPSVRGMDCFHVIRKKILSAVILSTLVFSHSLWAAEADLTSFSIEQLMELEVSSASKFPQKVSEAPAAVTVITSKDIKAQGYRTFADVLRGVRGLYITYDRNYSYIGSRGFGRPGDYNTRILFLLDGNRLNDNVYDLGLIGTEFILDLELIDRIEFVPGPGSAVYGNNAFFGVINVITKKSQQLDGLEVAAEVAGYGTHKKRMSYGHKLSNGMEFSFAGSVYRSQGENRFFPDFDDPTTSNGIAQGLDYDRYQRLFAKLEGAQFVAEVAYSDRKKGVPTAAFGQNFNDPRSYTDDFQVSINLAYNNRLTQDLDFLARVYHGQYDYLGSYVFAAGPSQDRSKSRWWGTEARLINTSFTGHKLLAGMEYQWNPHQDQHFFNPDTNVYSLIAAFSSDQLGFYLQDEYKWNERWMFNVGLRWDKDTLDQTHVNPRFAAIYKASAQTTLKALYGTAYRAPNAYEKFYFSATGELQAEKIKTLEGVIEHYFSNDMRFSLSAYRYKIDDLIELDNNSALFFVNLGKTSAHGIEVEGEQNFENDARLKISYTWQHARDVDSGGDLDNSPKNIAKLNYRTPLLNYAFQVAVELQYTGERKTYLGGSVDDFMVANVTLISARLIRNTELYASIYNVFDNRYLDPPSDEHIDSSGRALTGLPQNGRDFRVGVTHKF